MAKIKMQPLDAETVTLEGCFADYMAKCRARNLTLNAVSSTNTKRGYSPITYLLLATVYPPS